MCAKSEEELKHFYTYACKALGLVNKLKPGAFKSRFASDAMSKLQKVRAEMLRRDII